MLRYAILTLAVNREITGYELSKVFDNTTTYVWPAGQNQIYPELQKLEAEGLLSGKGVDQDGRPAKRVFRITDAGVQALDSWIATLPSFTTFRDAFQLRVFNFGRIPADISLELIEHQQGQLRERLGIFQAIADTIDRDGLPPGQDGWRMAVQAGIMTHQAYLDWCDWVRDRIVAREANQTAD
ncbi:transcriptional regulator, PadR family [Frankineae bacterium MT45]|nr:transcriptional regulator, PadR family [Frankineae bacterium MT45]